MNVTVVPAVTVWAEGWVVIVGFVVVLVTVSFAALEVVLPLAFVTTQRYCRLFSDATAEKLKVAVLYPVDLQFVHVLPFVLYCH